MTAKARLRRLARGVTLGLALCAAAGGAAAQCKVFDAELQGSYRGPCVEGLAEGEGVATGTAEYRGAFKAGKKHGRGVKTWPSGDRYEGGFAEDRKHGEGKYTWGAGPWQGESYAGAYLNDQRHGLGTYRWPTGDVYSGPWENDAITGQPTPMMLARAKFEEEARAAVAKPGRKVCRVLAPGARGYERVSGTVVEVGLEQIAIRIDEPGAGLGAPGAAGGAMLRAGEILRDAPDEWVPCY